MDEQVRLITAEQQTHAHALVNHAGSALITGGPGTAKSTLLKIAAGKLLHPLQNTPAMLHGTVFITAAPTAVVAKGTRCCHSPAVHMLHGKPCLTVDSLLINDGIWERLAAAAQTGQLLRIIMALDEFAMVSASQFEELNSKLQRIAALCKLHLQYWLFGDENQLPPPCNFSICCSQSFRSLLARKDKQPATLFIVLQHVARQKCLDSLLFVNRLRAVQRGDPCPRLIEKIWLQMRERFISPTLPAPNPALHNIVCLRHTNKAADAINARAVDTMHSVLGRKQYILVGSSQTTTTFVLEQTVVNTKNLRGEDGNILLANGAICKIDAFLGTSTTHSSAAGCLNTRTLAVDKELCVVLRDVGGQEYTVCALPAADTDETQDSHVLHIASAAAMTVHKSQGQTLSMAVNIDGHVPTWELFLVQMTRATLWENVYFVPIHYDHIFALASQPLSPQVAAVQRLIQRRVEQRTTLSSARA